ncbi:Uncharacterised protein [Mycobacteroides abscessus subsp. abscessus]|nr:Uncharacterised protein [Mycobacteroides abscessus subsp. abscessus]
MLEGRLLHELADILSSIDDVNLNGRFTVKAIEKLSVFAKDVTLMVTITDLIVDIRNRYTFRINAW